jgi:hypothetical protein
MMSNVEQKLPHKPDVQHIMNLARRFRQAHSQDYDTAYSDLETAVYDLALQRPADAVPPCAAQSSTRVPGDLSTIWCYRCGEGTVPGMCRSKPNIL